MKYLDMGSRIRMFRERRGLSVDQLAETIGYDADRMRRIELNEEQPIIGHLIRLCKALGVNVADLFKDRPVSKVFEIIRGDARPKMKPQATSGDSQAFDYTYELLAHPSEDKHLDIYMVTLPPLTKRRPRDDVSHEGEEFIYVVEGEIEGEVNGERIHLKPGDSIYFRSTARHVFFNKKENPARLLAVLYPF